MLDESTPKTVDQSIHVELSLRLSKTFLILILYIALSVANLEST